MEISYPRDKRKIKLEKSAGVLYVLFGRARSGGFWLMDFWGKPYTFRKYKDAVNGQKFIAKKMKLYQWEDPKPLIMKIEF
jgi:hypothetical protein